MNPLSALYGAVTQFRNLIYDSGFFSAQLHGPVISVGSISAGGAGKTPLVLLLGELLKARQVAFDVLSRGYGRKSSGVRLVDPSGEAAEFGDEPLLIARRLAVPVVVGENRYHAGLFAEQKFGPQLHLLDDGFQHRALARDFDIALFTPADALDRLLPLGRLREPRSSLERADAIALAMPVIERVVNVQVFVSFEPGSSVSAPSSQRGWLVHRKTTLPATVPARAIAFCGIARPDPFFKELTNAGVALSDVLTFPDHHRYCQRDIQRLLELRDSKAADGFITTEKDSINLGVLSGALQPLTIARVELELEYADSVIADMLETVHARHQARS